MSSKLDNVLNRLEGVKQTGYNKFIACCPAHKDQTPSLAITEKDERILLHCFAGCEPDDVLGAIGLTFSDVMPERVGTEHRYKPMRQRFNARQVLGSIDHAALVISIIGADFLKNRMLTEPSWQRLSVAVGYINTIRAEIAPMQHKLQRSA